MGEALSKVASALAPSQKTRIAIFPFPERGRGETLLGEYVMDKLMNAFGSGGQVELVERSRLESLRAEQKLSMSGEITDESAVSIGNMAGAEAVVVGTLTDLGAAWELSARMLGAEDGKVRAVAEAQFAGASVPPGLAGQPTKAKMAQSSGGGASGGSGGAARGEAAHESSAVFASEFEGVPEGELPSGWEAGDSVGVVRGARAKALGSLARGRHKIVVPNVGFPQDFEVDAVFEFWGGCPNFKLKVGSVEAGIGSCHHYFLTNATIGQGPPTAEKQRLDYSLRKEGQVFKFFIDGAQVGMSRVSDFAAPTSVTIEVHPEFLIHKLEVRSLK